MGIAAIGGKPSRRRESKLAMVGSTILVASSLTGCARTPTPSTECSLNLGMRPIQASVHPVKTMLLTCRFQPLAYGIRPTRVQPTGSLQCHDWGRNWHPVRRVQDFSEGRPTREQELLVRSSDVDNGEVLGAGKLLVDSPLKFDDVELPVSPVHCSRRKRLLLRLHVLTPIVKREIANVHAWI